MRSAELDSQGRPHLEGDIWTKTFEQSSAALWGKRLCRENGLQRPLEYGHMEVCLECLRSYEEASLDGKSEEGGEQ